MFPAKNPTPDMVYRKVYRSLSLAGPHSRNAATLNPDEVYLARQLVDNGMLEDVFINGPLLPYQHCFRVVRK